jgi:glutathione peroxidase
MNITSLILSLAVAAVAFAVPAIGADGAVASPLQATMTSADGKPYPLAQHRGQVILLVNVASKCGLTPQYSALEALHDKYKDAGFVVIGVPANNFKGQEPGTNEEIQAFCKTKYDVSFPVLGKVSVKGDDIDPLYKYLTTASPKPGEIGWNFAKFLINRKGEVVDRFEPKTKPDDAAVAAAIENALKEPAPKQ